MARANQNPTYANIWPKIIYILQDESLNIKTPSHLHVHTHVPLWLQLHTILYITLYYTLICVNPSPPKFKELTRTLNKIRLQEFKLDLILYLKLVHLSKV